MRRSRGYSLVELVLVIAIFGIVITLISTSFNRIVASSAQVIKSVETDIGGLIGLELFRVELGFAGFGLPWSVGTCRYDEAVENHTVAGIAATGATNFNDSPSKPPRPFVLLNNKGFHGSDYLVLKGTALSLKPVGRSWSYLNYTSTGAMLKPSKSEVELVPGNKDRVIVINTRPRGGVPTRDLVLDHSSFVFNFDRGSTIPEGFRPRNREDRYILYGLAPVAENSEDTVSFPFNRADYFVGPSDSSSANCAPGTGALLRGAIAQKGGTFQKMPILDCVGDMQVIFRVDTSNDETLVPEDLEAYAQAHPDDAAEAIRTHVKEVRVYILAQQGKKDSAYSYPVTDSRNVIVLGDPDNGRAWSATNMAATFGRDWRHYHWKVFTIVVQPKNIQ